jgi:flavin-dependent dehydrogenase
LDHAHQKGVEVHRGVRVLDAVFEGERAIGVRLLEADAGSANGSDAERMIRARVIVDASGQQGVLSGRAAARLPSVDMRKAAIWGHFRGARREIVDDGVMTLVLRTRSNKCWFWHIPLSDDVVSIGVVGDADFLFPGRGTPDQIFAEEVADCPSIAERLAGAERIAGLDVVKEYSYKTERSAGDGWVFVGDAWGFIDPLYSSGVWFALKSGQLAADCIIESFRKNDLSAAQLGKWVPEFNVGTNWVRKLVLAFYTGRFRVGQFIREYPQHQRNMTDILIGRIFYPEAGRIFDDLDPWLERMKLQGATS